MQKKFMQQSKRLELTQKELRDQNKINIHFGLFSDSLKYENDVLRHYSGINEFMRRRCT